MATLSNSISQPLKWHGGKGYLADWIIGNMAPHTRYAEPFAGGLSVLFRKPSEGVAEFINDLNRGLTNFWRVLRDHGDEFIRRASLVPLSMVEWSDAECLHDQGEAIEAALRFFVRARQSRQGLMRDYTTPTGRTRRGMNEQVSAWLSAVDGLSDAVERLRRVEIWNVDAVEFIRKLDSPDTLFYCDPPYLHETRVTTSDYAHEMSIGQHLDLLAALSAIKGKFLLSGYPSQLYDSYAESHGWRRVHLDIDNKASSAATKPVKRECLWANYDLPTLESPAA